MTMKEKMDVELMQLIYEKHRPALEELYDRYVKLVYSYALKATRGNNETTKEIVQQVFLRIWTTKSKFDSNKGQFVNWIITITRNITIDIIRKEQKYKENIDFRFDHFHQLEDKQDVEHQVSKKLLKMQIQHAQNKLSVAQQRLIQLLYWEGYSIKEIAELENEPIGTVKSRLHQSLKQLRHYLRVEREGER
ncbi:RNA polymerase sigma-70 factor, ECF subfamily [Bacillus sp. OV194]|nr:RNA polymerase sigma-70 factor, ECF subfamily [Bacillus sp. OV194]